MKSTKAVLAVLLFALAGCTSPLRLSEGSMAELQAMNEQKAEAILLDAFTATATNGGLCVGGAYWTSPKPQVRLNNGLVSFNAYKEVTVDTYVSGSVAAGNARVNTITRREPVRLTANLRETKEIVVYRKSAMHTGYGCPEVEGHLIAVTGGLGFVVNTRPENIERTVVALNYFAKDAKLLLGSNM